MEALFILLLMLIGLFIIILVVNFDKLKSEKAKLVNIIKGNQSVIAGLASKISHLNAQVKSLEEENTSLAVYRPILDVKSEIDRLYSEASKQIEEIDSSIIVFESINED